MNKIIKISILILVIAILGAGVYFAGGKIGKQIQDFQETDIGQTISEAGKKIFTSSPLNVGGNSNATVLLKSKIIEETNLQRQQNGLPALKENQKLNQAAAAKANDMFAKQYFEHISPSGIDPGKLVQNNGYEYIVAGENLISGNFASEKEAVQDWMNSPGHRANILNSRYTEIGAAIIKGIYNGETVWMGVQEFGLPLSVCPEPNVALKNQINSQKAELENLFSQIDEQRNQINNTNPRSAPYNQMVNDYNQLVSQYNLLAQQTEDAVATYNIQANNFNTCVAGK